jgi:hypothetical protein
MSETQRKKLSRRLWSKAREVIGDADVVMHDDPLGNRYSVNKYAIIVEGEDYDTVLDCRSRLLALLMIEGWNIEDNGRSSADVRHPSSLASARIRLIEGGPSSFGDHYWRWDIGVYS